MSPAAAARSILITSTSVFLEPETDGSCAGVGMHLADNRGALLLPVAADSALAAAIALSEEVPAVALVVDVAPSPVTRRDLPRLQLTGWLSFAAPDAWSAAGGWSLAASDVVLRLDPQIVVLVTDHGVVDVDLDDYQYVPLASLPVRQRVRTL
jgi:hypothetical protein